MPGFVHCSVYKFGNYVRGDAPMFELKKNRENADDLMYFH